MANRHRALVLFASGLSCAAVATLASPLWAETTEPNGESVPDILQADNPLYEERTLQDYFDSTEPRETIDAVAAADREPGKFSPLCSFTATLELSVSQAMAGIAWYNVDESDPTTPPADADLHHIILPESGGQMIDAATIRNDPAFVGPYVGFALTRYDNDATLTGLHAIYYSEYQRNLLCSDCSPPDHWVAALAYRSSLSRDTYYLAFEDWPMYGDGSSGAWQNDGDFNDKVFKLEGISCAGGGRECDVPNGIGLCGKGISECAIDGGIPTCTPVYEPRDEACDDIDNDCDGTVDEGELCPTDKICVRGSCVFSCAAGEFSCPYGWACGADGYCIEEACVNVACDPGLACRGGICTSPCSGIVCPLNQTCVDGTCKDLCSGKVCPIDSVCDPTKGGCVGTCGCTPCEGGKVCNSTTGTCVPPGCESVQCEPGTFCVLDPADSQVKCADACFGTVCPGGAACVDGNCQEPVTAALGGQGGGGSGSGTIDPGDPSGGTTGATPPTPPSSSAGCGCRTLPSGGVPRGLGLLLAAVGAVALRRAAARRRLGVAPDAHHAPGRGARCTG